MTLTKLEPEYSDDSTETSSFSESKRVLTSHDESVIRELLMHGLNLPRVVEVYKDRLSADNIVAISRRLLIETGSGRDDMCGDDDDDDSEASLGSTRINKNQHFCDIGIDILRLSPCDLVMESELLKHHITNLSQSAPEEFFDPIFSHIMSDPVVISSGFIVDRSTAISKDSGVLQFDTCPWSREKLDRKVYPAMRLKLQLNEFKSGRVGEMVATASLLLKAKNERDFCKVMEMAQDFMEDIGPKGHRALAVQLAQLGLCTLELESSDTSKLCILQPPFLTRQLLMLYALEPENLVAADLPRRALEMSTIAQQAIDANQFDEAEKLLACCDQIQDQCRDMLVGDKEIPVAQITLDLARKRGDSNLVPFQRRVYQGFLRDGKTAAAQKFLEHESVSALDLRDLSPCFFGRGALSSRENNDSWHKDCRSSPLEGEVSHIIVSAINFRDQGWGNCKGRLGLALYSANDELVARCNLYGTYRSPSYAFSSDNLAYRLLEVDQEVVSKCTPGCYYALEFSVGGGGGHEMLLDSFICKVFYKEWLVTEAYNGCYRMHDPEGDAGVFLGRANEHGVAHGKGRLEYDDGITFVGTFADGLMLEGTNYENGKAVHTMVGGTWTSGSDLEHPDEAMVARFPLDVNDITEMEE